VVVANSDINNKLDPSSNFSSILVDLAAPGTEIESTLPMTKTAGFAIRDAQAKKSGINSSLPTKYGKLTGTSMSTPCVAGALALRSNASGVAVQDAGRDQSDAT
jgi:thermitase